MTPGDSVTEPAESAVILRTPRLLLRELTDADHARLHQYYQNPNVNRFIGGPPPPLEEYLAKGRETWSAYYREHGFGLWGVVRREDGELLGRCGLLAQEIDGEREIEVGYAFGEEHWGRGYATEAATACRDHAFRTLDVPHVISLILPENLPSISVAERNGMTFWKMADFRAYHVRVYRITREEWERLEPA